MTRTTALDFVRIILDRARNNKELAKTLFEKLFAELPQQVDAIRRAFDNEELQLAIDITHKLHGSVSFCGLDNIRKPAEKLETCLRNFELEPIERHYGELDRQVDLFITEEDEIMRILATI